MPKIILGPKQFLTGSSSDRFTPNGIFRHSYTKGIDIFRNKGYYGMLQQGCGQTDLTGSVIKDTIKWFVQKDGDYYGYGADGYLYKFPFASNYVPTELDHANLSGRVGGRGLAIYHDGTSDKLHYFAGTTIGIYDFTTTYNNNYKTGLTDAPHPAKEWQGVLYYGNGRYVGKLTGTTEDLTALTLPAGYEVQDIDIYSGYIAILAHKATGALNTECKLFLWDGYTTGGWNLEYVVPEKAYSLEKYKDGLAIFGYNIRLFGVAGYENFDVIHNIESTTVYPGQTCYNNNTLFWQEYVIISSFGSPNSRIKPSIQTPLLTTGEKGAIININPTANHFLVSRNDKLALLYNTGYSGGFVRTIDIELPLPSKIRSITLVMEKLVANDGVQVSIYDDLATQLSSKVISYAVNGAITQKTILLNTNLTNFFYLYFDWSAYSAGNLIIKKVIIDYETAELKQ